MKPIKRWSVSLSVLVVATGISSYACAQTFESNSNGFETPVGMNNLTEIDSPASLARDENFNRTEINRPGGTFAVTAVGNLINVVTEGRNSTVVVNANQNNTGSLTATFDSGEGFSATESSTGNTASQ
ncbi:MAG: hypothetical protein HC848_00900 [Limnobacter sp.]|nr:hypothetical protein [Limnobacter sp.]